MQALRNQIVALEARINGDLLAHFGEIDYHKVMIAYGAHDDDYLSNDNLVNCAGALSSLTHAQFLANNGDIAGAYNAINQATHFWTLLYGAGERQRRVASKPRPKKVPTNKKLTTDAMCKWRRTDRTFDDFIEAAQNDSIGDFEIEVIADNRFLLSWSTTNEEKKSKKTLLDWWTDSGKKI